MKYDPTKIEKKWQKEWEKQKLYQTLDTVDAKKNYMLLTEFPYPSGNLHLGHWYAFALPDIKARYLRMKGYNVMYPIGFDAFGLPAENAAIKHNINPRDWTEQNIAHMTKQFESMGASFDWSRVVSTIDPEYYKWTQWIFLQFYKKNLAYRATTKVNWCPKDKTVLANEQVIDGKCERDGEPVVQKELEQWMFKITKYADQLADDLEQLEWPRTTKIAQQNWIGRSEGASILFIISQAYRQFLPIVSIEVFTTRPDTIYGATFLVVSPEKAQAWLALDWKASEKIKAYINEALHIRELERMEQKEKTGVFAEFTVKNQATGEDIPVWISDYVINSYGTGAIMAVPAHDERDREFAQKFNLPISDAALKENNFAESRINYRLRDWVLSRQRYWGVPIPMIKCADCGYQPVTESELPVVLPKLDDFHPTDDGRSPLAKATEWVIAKCPNCAKDAQRETDTMDTFVDSSWYFLRYTDPHNAKEFAAQDKIKSWLPVPQYVGGAEHNTMHLLYSRFFTKALHELGYVPFDEPFLGRVNHGTILGPDGQKMSKSRGNVIDPDEEVAKYGADAMRMYLAFVGPYDQNATSNKEGIIGTFRFLNRVWILMNAWVIGKDSLVSKTVLHKAIKKIGQDIQDLHFNTAVSELMKLLNYLEEGTVHREALETFLKLLAPLAPHITEEIWHGVLGNKDSIHAQPWPKYEEKYLQDDEINLPVQVGGKIRAVLVVPADISEEKAKELAVTNPDVQRHVGSRTVQKIFYIPGKVISIVIS